MVQNWCSDFFNFKERETNMQKIFKTFAELKTIKLNLGNIVLCDFCTKDFTHSDKRGGFLFRDKAVCPNCAPAFRKDLTKLGEMHFISAECPKHLAFKDFIYLKRKKPPC